jgi:hypothetical protein
MKGPKAIPTLPKSSRMQMPSGGGAAIKKGGAMNGKATSNVKSMGKSKGVLGATKKVMPKKPY